MALTQVQSGMMDSIAQYNSFKNRIINGAMVISQRNAAASVTPAAAGQYLVDRWVYYASQTSKFTAQQNAGSVTPPAGFTNYLGFTSSSAYSVTGNDYFLFQQVIEGLNFYDLAWGTANAATVTLSFWVRSSLTGTFGGALRNYGGTGRSYPFTYTISSANTWEQKSITIVGSTDGTWNTTNTGALQLTFSLGASGTELGTAGAWSSTVFSGATGQVNVVGTNGATFYVTGVQLEKGSTATAFDYRPYGTELSLCQRYLPAFTTDTATAIVGTGGFASTTRCAVTYTYPVTPRVSPTGVTVSNATDFNVSDNSAGAVCTTITFNAGGLSCAQLYFNTATVYAAYRAGIGYSNTTAAKLLFTGCEL